LLPENGSVISGTFASGVAVLWLVECASRGEGSQGIFFGFASKKYFYWDFHISFPRDITAGQ